MYEKSKLNILHITEGAMARFNEKLSWFNNNFFNMFWFRNTWHVLKYSNKLIYEGEYWENSETETCILYFWDTEKGVMACLSGGRNCLYLSLMPRLLLASLVIDTMSDWSGYTFVVTWQQWVIIDTTRKNWLSRSLRDPLQCWLLALFKCTAMTSPFPIFIINYPLSLTEEQQEQYSDRLILGV